jgi:hypothetical protein
MSDGKQQQKNRGNPIEYRRFHVLPPEITVNRSIASQLAVYTVTAAAFSTGCFVGAITTSTTPTLANATTALFAVAKN